MAIEEYEEETTVVREEPTARGTVVRSRVTEDLPTERVSRFAVVYYILNIIEALLLIRFVLKLLGANPNSGFVNGMYAITEPLIAPFRGIFPTAAAQGSVLEWSTLIAMVIYALIAYAIVQLLRISFTHRSTI